MNPQENQSPTPPPSGPSSFVPGSQYVNYGHATPPTEVPSPVPTQAPFEPRPPRVYKPKRSHHVGLIVSIVIVLFVVLGIGAVYAFSFTPDHALLRAVSVLAGKYKFSSNVSISVTSDDPDVSGSLTLSANTDGTTKPVRVQSFIDLETPSYPVSAEIRFADGILYGQITQVPQAASTYAGPYVNKWYSVSLSTFKAFAEKFHATSTLGTEGPTIAESYEKAISNGIIADRRFLGIGYSGGKLVRRYSFAISKDALLKQALSSSMAEDNPQFATALTQAEQVYSSVTIEPVLITVDLISGALVSFDDTISVAPGKPPLPSKGGKISIHFAYGEFSPAADLSAPVGATSLDGYLVEMMNSFDSARDRGSSARVQADLYQERMTMEENYATPGGYAGCSVGNMNVLMDDTRAQGSTPLCRSNSQAYVLAATLIDKSTTTASYYCVDSNGKTVTLSKLPTGYSCK